MRLTLSFKLSFLLLICCITFTSALKAQEKLDAYGITADPFKKLLFKVVITKTDHQKIVGYLEKLGQDSITVSTIKFVAVNKKASTTLIIPAQAIKKIRLNRTNTIGRNMLVTYGYLVLAGFVGDLLTFNSNFLFGFGVLTLVGIIYSVPLAAIFGLFSGLASALNITINGDAKVYKNELNRINTYMAKRLKKVKRKLDKRNG